ncbi:MAG: hypothetical protein F6K47_04155 [Symploca sp. SIO2E6]|nr:hypothetical protein [Symploca sp. SIO2E6]
MTASKYEEVVAAYRQLTEAGETPSQDKIKAIILDRTNVKMSNTTVSKHLRTLRASDPDEFLKGTQSEDNEPIPADHQPLMQKVYHSIRRATELTYSNDKMEKLEAEIEVLQEKLADAKATKQKLEGMEAVHNQLLDRMQDLMRENERLSQGISPEQAPLVEQLESQLKEATGKNEPLVQKVESLRQQLSEAQDEIAILANRSEELDETRLEQESTIHNLKIQNGEIERLKAQIEEHKDTIEKLTQKIGANNDQMTSIAGEVYYISPDVAQALETERQQHQAEIEQLKNQTTSVGA